jgi:hypothetical protein
LTQEQQQNSTQDNTTSTEVTHTIHVPAHKKVKATTTSSTTTQTDLYRVDITIRGRKDFEDIAVYGQSGSVNVPYQSPYDSIGNWFKLSDLPSLGPATKGTAEFSVTTVTSVSDYSEEEKGLDQPWA